MENQDKVICDCTSRISGCMSGKATTMTTRAFFVGRNLELLLYQDKYGELNVCGIADHDIMDKAWNITDKIYFPKSSDKKIRVCYDILYGGGGFSFLTLLLEIAGYRKEFDGMDAHHCNGNPFDHRIQNGILLFKDEHTDLHSAAARGNNALISFVKLLNRPELASKYINGERPVLFQTGDYHCKQETVIREACGSMERFSKLCKAVVENTKGQTEKEKKYRVIL